MSQATSNKPPASRQPAIRQYVRNRQDGSNGSASGKWQVASGKWQVASGKWQVATGNRQWQSAIGNGSATGNGSAIGNEPANGNSATRQRQPAMAIGNRQSATATAMAIGNSGRQVTRSAGQQWGSATASGNRQLGNSAIGNCTGNRQRVGNSASGKCNGNDLQRQLSPSATASATVRNSRTVRMVFK